MEQQNQGGAAHPSNAGDPATAGAQPDVAAANAPPAQQQPGFPSTSFNPALAFNPAMMVPGPGGSFSFPRPTGMPGQQPFFFSNMQAMQQAQQANAAAAAARRGVNKPAGRASSKDRKQCNCKNSRCLKLYCECFASGRYCDNCNCANCCNNRENETVRQAAVEAILERNPNAFRPKIAPGQEEGITVPSVRHNKGCNCKKSGCLKKYCECFQAGIVCSENCKCVDCKNFEGSDIRLAIMASHGMVDKTAAAAAAARRSMGIPNVVGNRPGMLSGFPSPTKGPGMPMPGLPQSKDNSPAKQVLAQQSAAAAQLQRQQAAKDAVGEVIKSEVVEKLAMLLMVVSQEELQRHRQENNTEGEQGGMVKKEGGNEEERTDGMEVDEEATGSGGVGVEAMDALYEAQERLVLTEFRDTLNMIAKVVGEKVEKKVRQATHQSSVLAALAAQQQHHHQVQGALGQAFKGAGLYTMQGNQMMHLVPQATQAIMAAQQQMQSGLMQGAGGMLPQQQQQQQVYEGDDNDEDEEAQD